MNDARDYVRHDEEVVTGSASLASSWFVPVAALPLGLGVALAGAFLLRRPSRMVVLYRSFLEPFGDHAVEQMFGPGERRDSPGRVFGLIFGVIVGVFSMLWGFAVAVWSIAELLGFGHIQLGRSETGAVAQSARPVDARTLRVHAIEREQLGAYRARLGPCEAAR